MEVRMGARARSHNGGGVLCAPLRLPNLKVSADFFEEEKKSFSDEK